MRVFIEGLKQILKLKLRMASHQTKHRMTYIIIGIILFTLGFLMRSRFKKKDHEAGVEGMTAILIASAILIIFYGIISKMMIL